MAHSRGTADVRRRYGAREDQFGNIENFDAYGHTSPLGPDNKPTGGIGVGSARPHQDSDNIAMSQPHDWSAFDNFFHPQQMPVTAPLSARPPEPNQNALDASQAVIAAAHGPTLNVPQRNPVTQAVTAAAAAPVINLGGNAPVDPYRQSVQPQPARSPVPLTAPVSPTTAAPPPPAAVAPPVAPRTPGLLRQASVDPRPYVSTTDDEDDPFKRRTA